MNIFIDYVSKATEPFNAAKLADLTSRAATFNYDVQISGFLYYDGSHFFQHIEGEPENIHYLFDHIKNDKRHNVVSYIQGDLEYGRLFRNWSMKLIQFEDIMSNKSAAQNLVQLMLKNQNSKDPTFWDMAVYPLINDVASSVYNYEYADASLR